MPSICSTRIIGVCDRDLFGNATGCLASAAVAGGTLPPKLNSIIQPLMGGLRREAEPLLQAAYAAAIARMLQLAASRTPCPNDRWVLHSAIAATAALEF